MAQVLFEGDVVELREDPWSTAGIDHARLMADFAECRVWYELVWGMRKDEFRKCVLRIYDSLPPTTNVQFADIYDMYVTALVQHARGTGIDILIPIDMVDLFYRMRATLRPDANLSGLREAFQGEGCNLEIPFTDWTGVRSLYRGLAGHVVHKYLNEVKSQ